ncbi:hypothetical protein CEF21_09745 [Bacillus sp. FJAT-42376]|nr:hypothetical protein CEF21_09745 [Bacillus sp. FJAT-42376]
MEGGAPGMKNQHYVRAYRFMLAEIMKNLPNDRKNEIRAVYQVFFFRFRHIYKEIGNLLCLTLSFSIVYDSNNYIQIGVIRWGSEHVEKSRSNNEHKRFC